MPINVQATIDFQEAWSQINTHRAAEAGPPYVTEMWGNNRDVIEFHIRFPLPVYSENGYSMPSENLHSAPDIRQGSMAVRWSDASGSGIYKVDRTSTLLITDFDVAEVT